jgi:hypothetical protein
VLLLATLTLTLQTRVQADLRLACPASTR